MIDKLFDYHLNSVDGFLNFAAYIFHWADSRRILSYKYMPVSALKLILIYFLIYNNIPNLIQLYLNEYGKNFDKIEQ